MVCLKMCVLSQSEESYMRLHVWSSLGLFANSNQKYWLHLMDCCTVLTHDRADDWVQKPPLPRSCMGAAGVSRNNTVSTAGCG